MKAIQLQKPEHFRLIDLPEPPAPGPGQALVRVHRVGICGTDFSGYLGKMPFYSYPRIPGHELGVEVAAVGPGVAEIQPGMRCAVEPYLNCGHCFACQRGASNCCETLQVLGVHTDGGLRPYFVVPANKLHPSDKLTLDQLALVETLGIGCHAVNRAQPQPGDPVLVIGAGPIGLSAIQFVELSGARTVVLDLNPRRLDFCRNRLGVCNTILSQSEAEDLEQFNKITGGGLAPVVIDATGSHKSMSRALQFVAFTGKLVFVGISAQEISFSQPIMHRREMTFLASRNALPQDFRRIIQSIEEGKIDTTPWITHHAAFERMPESFPIWLRPESGVVKAMVDVV